MPRLSIYLSTEDHRYILARIRDENLSGTITQNLHRYWELMDHEARSFVFTEAEASAICDALNGVSFLDDHAYLAVWAEVSDADRLSGLGEKWGIDAQALALRLRDLSPGAKMALVTAVETFWRNIHLPTDQALRKAGLVKGC